MCHFLKKEISLTYCEVFFTRRGESSPIKDYFLFLLLRNFSIGRCDAPKSTSEPGASGPLDVSRDNFRKSSGCISIMQSCLDATCFSFHPQNDIKPAQRSYRANLNGHIEPVEVLGKRLTRCRKETTNRGPPLSTFF